jgi:hypothetical protein
MELFLGDPFTAIDMEPRAANDGIVAYTCTVMFDILYVLNGDCTW